MLQRSFKCGINIKEDESENALVHIEGISEYVMPEADNSTWTLPPTKAMTWRSEILKPLTQRRLMKNDTSFHSDHEL